MALIRIYFVNTVKALGQEVSKRMADKVSDCLRLFRLSVPSLKSSFVPADSTQTLSDTASQALIYNKFTSLSTSLRPLIAELEHRVSLNPNELTSLLSECHSAWVSTRQTLMGVRVSAEIGRMDPDGYDLVDLVSRVG